MCEESSFETGAGKEKGRGGITVIDLVKGGEGDLPNVDVHLRIKNMCGFSVFFTDDFAFRARFLQPQL